MTDVLEFRLVDAFATKPYTGNTAGVVLNAEHLSDNQLQQVARAVNASETAFIIPARDAEHEPTLRWFTPTQEVAFCGHATLAAVHALFEFSNPRAAEISSGTHEPVLERTAFFTSSAGRLDVRCEPVGPESSAGIWWLTMPPPTYQPDRANPKKLLELCGLELLDQEPRVPLVRTRDDDLIVIVKRWSRLLGARPNFAALGAWCSEQRVRGVLLATCDTPTRSMTTYSRFFGPAVGVDEDPATGSAHGPLTALLIEHALVPLDDDGRAGLRCAQGESGGRTGLINVLARKHEQGVDVAISGRCFTVIRGTIAVPPKSGPPTSFVAD